MATAKKAAKKPAKKPAAKKSAAKKPAKKTAAKKAATFDGVKVAPDVRRKLTLLKVALVTPAPSGSMNSTRPE